MTGNNQINLPLENCFKKFNESFNRVWLFSCVADNLDVSALPEEWKIANETGLDYGFHEPENKQDIVDAYKHFMQRYLVRDCIESFALCLDELFFVLLLNGKKALPKQTTLMDVLSKEEQKLLKQFQLDGLRDKRDKLKKHFNLELSPGHKNIINSLKDIRDCFAHNNGVVRSADGQSGKDQKRKFSWKTLYVFTKGVQSGERRPMEFDKTFEEEVEVWAELKENCKAFQVGEHLSFSFKETFEIARSLSLIIVEIQKAISENIEPLVRIPDADSN